MQPEAAPQLSAFGRQLRSWRKRRGVSQLELAMRAGTTSRHVSFVETGRSRPGRDMVLRLAAALDVPLRERNVLLAAAGLRTEYAERRLDDAMLAPVLTAIEQLLERHEPYPGWCVARGLRFLRANRAAERLFPGATEMEPEALIDMWFGEGPYRDSVENWAEVAHAGLAVLRREHLAQPDAASAALLDRAQRHLRGVPVPEHLAPVACPTLCFGDARIRTVATVLRFDHAVEVTTSELKVELLFPADDAGARFFQSLAKVR